MFSTPSKKGVLGIFSYYIFYLFFNVFRIISAFFKENTNKFSTVPTGFSTELYDFYAQAVENFINNTICLWKSC